MLGRYRPFQTRREHDYHVRPVPTRSTGVGFSIPYLVQKRSAVGSRSLAAAQPDSDRCVRGLPRGIQRLSETFCELGGPTERVSLLCAKYDKCQRVARDGRSVGEKLNGFVAAAPRTYSPPSKNANTQPPESANAATNITKTNYCQCVRSLWFPSVLGKNMAPGIHLGKKRRRACRILAVREQQPGSFSPSQRSARCV